VADIDIEARTRVSVPDDWSDLDRRAVDTIRVLAADAVQKVGNGHPGTAMSLAPLAYTLFQRVMRHDPNDEDWIGRDRFVLSCGHSSLTLYIQLYLSGYGLELDDLKALRTFGSKTPGHPEHRHTPGIEITTGPLGQGVASAVGMAMAAHRERGLFDPTPHPGRARSTTRSTSSPPTATSRKASPPRRRPSRAPSSWATSHWSTTTTRSPSRTTRPSRCPRTPRSATRPTAGTCRSSRAARTSSASRTR
jgi:hypothetical protein